MRAEGSDAFEGGGAAMRAEGSDAFEGGGHDDAGVGAQDVLANRFGAGAESRVRRLPSSEVMFDLPPEGIDLDKLEWHMVEQALQRTGGNKTRAGALLGLTRDQVRYRMQKYGLDDKG